MPRIVIGVPVRDREWILPHWFNCVGNAALAAQECGHEVFVIALENDSVDDTLGLLSRTERELPDLGIVVVVGKHDFGYPHYKETSPQCPGIVVKERVNARNDKRELALLRNEIVDMFLAMEADYLLMWDSDVLMPRQTLTDDPRSLLSMMRRFPKIGILAADVEHPGCGGKYHNGMVAVGDGIYNHPDRSGAVPEERIHTVFVGGATYVDPEGYQLAWNQSETPYIVRVETTGGGGAAMVRREVFEAGLRYGAHHQGEDVPLCEGALRAGWQVCITNGILGTHISPQVFAETDIAAYASEYGMGVEEWLQVGALGAGALARRCRCARTAKGARC